MTDPAHLPAAPCPPRRSWMLLALFALHGCASKTAPTLAGTAAAPAARADASLSGERQWLQSWFAGTPVVITERRDGTVHVEIPREFCFDAGRSTIKPALAAVLDKVAQSLRRTPQARVSLLAAPGDGATPGPTPLPLQRATQVRAHLLARGVQAAQFGDPSAAQTPSVLLQLELVRL